eukprot:m.443486 g.443486  ORF g.443486 m.443486 type:complete len:93 (+) comp21484_c0_seq12:252-530(+)
MASAQHVPGFHLADGWEEAMDKYFTDLLQNKTLAPAGFVVCARRGQHVIILLCPQRLEMGFVHARCRRKCHLAPFVLHILQRLCKVTAVCGW